jgi:hypothetical protein
MKTKPLRKQSLSGSTSIVIEIPNSLIPEKPHGQIQALLRQFFLENPQILKQAFDVSNENTEARNKFAKKRIQKRIQASKKRPPLRKVSPQQIEETLSTIKALGNDDLEWLDEIIPARMDKEYPPDFFDFEK